MESTFAAEVFAFAVEVVEVSRTVHDAPWVAAVFEAEKMGDFMSPFFDDAVNEGIIVRVAAVVFIVETDRGDNGNAKGRICEAEDEVGKRFKEVGRCYQQDFFMEVIEFVVEVDVYIVGFEKLGITAAKDVKFRENFYGVTLLAKGIEALKRENIVVYAGYAHFKNTCEFLCDWSAQANWNSPVPKNVYSHMSR
jgi:hypothetical protein